jgi:hypothetical protein
MEFGMTPDIVFSNLTVRITHDDCITADEHGAERFVAAGSGFTREFEGLAHMRVVSKIVELGCRHGCVVDHSNESVNCGW